MVHRLNTNKQFMTGSFILGFGVIFIVVIFLYMSMRSDWDPSKPTTYLEEYEISLSNGFAGESFQVLMGDSIIFDGIVTEQPMVLKVGRFEENTTLMLVNNETEGISLINLGEKSGRFVLVNEDGTIRLR